MCPCFFAPGPSFSVSKSSFRHLKAFSPPLLFYHQLDFFFFSEKSEAESPSRSQSAQLYWWHWSSADFFQTSIWLRDFRSAYLADAATLEGLVRIGIFRGLFRC